MAEVAREYSSGDFCPLQSVLFGSDSKLCFWRNVAQKTISPFTPKSYQFNISPAAASPEM